MPVRTIAGTDLAYALVIFDEKGDERPEPDGTFLSETLAQRVADPARPVTDVFFTAPRLAGRRARRDRAVRSLDRGDGGAAGRSRRGRASARAASRR